MKKILLLFFIISSFTLSAQVILSEDFETASVGGDWPNGWSSTDSDWTLNDPSTGTPNYGGAASIVEPAGTSANSGNCTNVYAVVDSDGLGNGNTQSTSLVSPSFDLSGVVNPATNRTTIEIEFTDNIKLEGDIADISGAFSIYRSADIAKTAIVPTGIAAAGDGKKVTLTVPEMTASQEHKISYDPSRLSDTNAKDNFLFADNSDSVKNYRIKEISEQTFNTPS